MRDYSLATLREYSIQNPLKTNVLRQRLYDFQLYATAGVAQMTFFAIAQGAGVTSSLGAVVGSVKTYADTNMDQGGALPKGKSYLAESIEVIFEPGGSAAASTFIQATPNFFNAVAALAILAQLADINALRVSGWLELFAGSTTWLWEAPLGTFPPKVRLDMDAAIASNSATTAEVGAVAAKFGGRPYYLEPAITLDGQMNFAVYLKWPGAVATPSGFNGRIGVVFDGVMYRNSQ